MNPIYEVQTIDRASGADHWVRVAAPGKEEARERVIALGEVVGEVRLVEIPADALPAIPGAVRCPSCGASEWHGGRGLLLWVGVVLLFPVGLLLLMARPTWRCDSCGYAFKSFQTPATLEAPRGARGFLYSLIYAILVVIAILGAIMVLGLLLGSPR